MVIPIPAQQQRFTAHLGITAQRPGTLGIVVYDPGKPHSDYFRRKIAFAEEDFRDGKAPLRQLRVPMAVSPGQLVLEVYNKDRQDYTGFEVVHFELEALPPADVWGTPEQHRFMAFAIPFAQKAGHVPSGFYESDDHEFLIQYLPTITNEAGEELVTPARIHRQMPRVQLSQRLFRQFSIPVRVAILAHEGCHYFLNTRSERQADRCGLQYYLDYGFPKIEAVYAATQVFNKHRPSVGPSHVNRAADIIDFIDRYTTKKLKKAS